MSIRDNVVDQAKQWIGLNEADGSHKKIVNIYNSIKPLPQGYKLKYTDAWCAGFVSAVAQSLGLTSVIYPECSCDRMIALYKKYNKWVENDSYTPSPGDIIFYDWQDTGVGDNVGSSDHVGIVESVVNNQITVIEGNISDKVGRRTIAVNGKYIRGYGTPNYSDNTSTEPTVSTPATASNAQIIYNLLRANGLTHEGAVGFLCNLDAESGLSPNNMENSYERVLGYNDNTYTAAVDKGTYTNFVDDSVGYGIAQWTYHTRKKGLLDYAKQLGVSISDLTMQVQYLIKELKSDFPAVWKVVTTTKSIQEASDIVLMKFENPANAASQKAARYNRRTKFMNLKVTSDTSTSTSNKIPTVSTTVVQKVISVQLVQLSKGAEGAAVKTLQTLLNARGFNCGIVDGEFGNDTETALKNFQKSVGLKVDGICGINTWKALICG